MRIHIIHYSYIYARAGAEQLANVVLCKCPSLIALNMGLNAIGAQGAEAIVSVLSQRPDMALRRLDLSFNGIGSAGFLDTPWMYTCVHVRVHTCMCVCVWVCT